MTRQKGFSFCRKSFRYNREKGRKKFPCQFNWKITRDPQKVESTFSVCTRSRFGEKFRQLFIFHFVNYVIKKWWKSESSCNGYEEQAKLRYYLVIEMLFFFYSAKWGERLKSMGIHHLIMKETKSCSREIIVISYSWCFELFFFFFLAQTTEFQSLFSMMMKETYKVQPRNVFISPLALNHNQWEDQVSTPAALSWRLPCLLIKLFSLTGSPILRTLFSTCSSLLCCFLAQKVWCKEGKL